jgi:hypothetical protein
MGIRFTEDLRLRTPATPKPVHTVTELRRRLALDGAPVDTVVAAVRTWLGDNDASATLVTSIARSPYAAALAPEGGVPLA